MKKMEDILIAADDTSGKKQRKPFFKKTRSGVELTREQIQAIKAGRSKLRKELRAQGIKGKRDFELTASSLGLYFDRNRAAGLLMWFFHGRALWALVGATAVLLSSLFLFAVVTQMRGHFTVNMSDGMFQEGFVLSETIDFENATTHLFCTPADEVPCISISHLPSYLDSIDGQHNESYFAYTFYIRNEGLSTVGYEWRINLNSESQDLSSACWVMIFEDGRMTFYAEPNEETGEPEALPAFDDNSRGYLNRPLEEFSLYPETQYQTITERNGFRYNRVIPLPFESETIVARGTQEVVAPDDIHKYTVVIWLEGDDPDCTDELIGGHLGMEVYMRLLSEEVDLNEGENSWRSYWDAFWDNLIFWDN